MEKVGDSGPIPERRVNIVRSQILKRTGFVFLTLLVLAGCTVRGYETGHASIKDLDTDWFRASSSGNINTTKRDAADIVLLRIAEYCVENDAPYFKVMNEKAQQRSHYRQWVSGYGIPIGEKQYQGSSYRAFIDFFPIPESDLSRHANAKVLSAKKVIEEYKHLRVKLE